MLHLLIDGYNLLHASRRTDHDWTRLDLEDGRAAILSFLASHRRPAREPITVVFDGAGERMPHSPSRVHGVEVVFSPPGVKADEVIVDMVRGAPNPKSLLVVTDDRGIQDQVKVTGAKIVGSLGFLARSLVESDKRSKAPPREPREKYTGPGPGEVDKWRKILGFDDEDETGEPE
jgi:predicted RNA-binding protein with PIN domain